MSLDLARRGVDLVAWGVGANALSETMQKLCEPCISRLLMCSWIPSAAAMVNDANNRLSKDVL